MRLPIGEETPKPAEKQLDLFPPPTPDEALKTQDPPPLDVSISYRVPSDNPPCKNCRANSIIFEDPTSETISWVMCSLGIALTEGNLPKILEIRQAIADSTKPECLALKYTRILLEHIKSKIAQALSSEQVPEEFRSTDTSREDRVGGD